MERTKMPNYQIVPAVDAVREFLEIAGDFTNPLEVVREAVSNAMDANADRIGISFTRPKEGGKSVLVIEISDNGEGMNEVSLQSFFDLGNSLKRGDAGKIGEKGHGTKVYFNCSSIRVDTVREGRRLTATMNLPFARLHDGQLPTAAVEAADAADNSSNGTHIIIKGFNGDNGEDFTHDRLRDYVKWFTKFGSWEHIIGIEHHKRKILVLKGLDAKQAEDISFGHYFPDHSPSVEKLFDTYVVRAPDYYCKRIVKHGNLRRRPEVEFDAVFSIEGNKVKQTYNGMLRRQGYAAPRGAYTVQERYGIWLCKDFIPIERRNEWVGSKGSEYTKFHAFVNCQEFSLTANRGSIANTDPVVLEDIKEAVQQIYEGIISGDEWRQIDWLEEQAGAYVTAEKESKDFKWRQDRARNANTAFLDGHTLVEPSRESGVYALLVQLATLSPTLFPFEIVDYDTHSGIDVIAKLRDAVPVAASTLHYIELKYFLGSSMNHSFDNIRFIVCWDTEIKHGGTATDLAGQERTLYVAPADPKAGGYTGYFLRRDFKTEIQVFVLKDYLREMLGIEFRPRTVAQARFDAATQ
jgi:hypothetical protein